MLYARDFIFNSDAAWRAHLRVDSSPQFAKNYLVAEADRISFANDGAFVRLQTMNDIRIEIRLLPLQVLGKQATNTAYKTKSCCRMLDLESRDGILQDRLRSITTDFGVESGLWLVPNFERPEEKVFPHVLPIADLDHGIHHCMNETALAYDGESWVMYQRQLAAISKLFGKRETVDRFVKFHIWDNHQIPQAARSSLAKMFDVTCPSLCEHRWHYNFEVLRWICKRQAFFQYLEPRILQQNNENTNINKDEMAALGTMLVDRKSHDLFWAIAWVEFRLHSWGFSVSRWLHGCPCHSRFGCSFDRDSEIQPACEWNGRRIIQVAEGKLDRFHDELLCLRIETCKFADAALKKLDEHDAISSTTLRNSFQTAKRKVALRFKQAMSYLGEFPWNLPRLLGFICPQPEGTTLESKVAESKRFASELVSAFDAGALKPQGTFGRFLDKSDALGQSLRKWAHEDVSADLPMAANLFQELAGYSTTLLCMQRLESRHHLVNQRMSIARASSPSTLSANLRRSLNADSHQSLFRENFSSYLLRFDELIPYTWQSRSELVKLVSGYHSNVMFANICAEQSLIESQAIQNRSTKEYSEQLAHLKSVLEEGSFYAVLQSESPTTYVILQVVSMHPSAKRYMQRAIKWSADPWNEKLSVVFLGQVAPENEVIAVDDDDDDHGGSYKQLTSSFTFSSTESFPSELLASNFFVCNFDGVYKLDDVSYKSVFALDGVNNSTGDTLELCDLSLRILVSFHVHCLFMVVLRFFHSMVFHVPKKFAYDQIWS